MGKLTRFAVLILVVVTIGVMGLVFYVRASIHHLGFLTTSDVERLLSAANEAHAVAAQNKACLFTIDESSLGDKGHEAEMLYVAAMLDLYKAKLGVAARSLADLDKLRDFNQSNRLDRRRLQKDCAVYVDPSGATVVSCVGSKPSTTELARLASGAEYVQKFYRLGQGEVLYIPAAKC
jgi:hypothetical protein